jgi:hypothetical protein
MWSIAKLEFEQTELDFTSSGQGRRTATAVCADGVKIINAAELLEFEEEYGCLQVFVCSHCGYSHCESGNFVSVRKAGNDVIWLPAWSAISEENWPGEYAPPAFLRKSGLPVFNRQLWSKLVALVPGLPEYATIRALSHAELVRALQIQAPGRFLGEWPGVPAVRDGSVLAVSNGDAASVVEELNRLLERAGSESASVKQLSRLGPVEPIELFLDLPEFPSWSGLARISGEYVLVLGELAAWNGEAC